MAGSKKTAFVVVGRHKAEVRIVVVSVDKDYRQVIVIYAFNKCAVCTTWNCNYSIDPSGQQEGCTVIENLLIFHRVYHYGRVVAAVDFRDDDASHFCEIGVGQRGKEETDSIGLVCAQTLRNK